MSLSRHTSFNNIFVYSRPLSAVQKILTCTGLLHHYFSWSSYPTSSYFF